jgi:hypothetical protein
MPTRASFLSVAFVLASVCTARADSTKSAPKSASPAAAPTVEARAKALIQKQLKALPEDNAALSATFAKDAIVLLPYGAAKVDAPDLELCAAIAGLHPHAEMKQAKLTGLVAGGSASMVWLAADLEIVVLLQEPGETPSSEAHTVHALELLDAGSDWKVVAASFAEVRPLAQRRSSFGALPSPTSAGPLVPLLASPDKLAAAIGADPVMVYGTDKAERAVGGAAAKALLGKWRKLPLAIEDADAVREIRTANWAYAMAHVNIAKAGGPPYRMNAFVIAVPAANSTWSVVAASYGAL